MKTLKLFMTISFFLLSFCLNLEAQEISINLSNFSTSQDSLYGTFYSSNIMLPSELTSTSKIIFAEMRLNSNLALPDSNTMFLSEILPLSSDGTPNTSLGYTNILTLARDGNVNYDISNMIQAWVSGDIQNNGFVIRKKHDDPSEPNPTFVSLPSGNIAEIRIIYSN